MKHFLKFVPALLFAVFLIRPAVAVSISYTLDFNEDGKSGQYNYTISNDSDLPLDAFKIYFEYDSYEALQLIDSDLYLGWTISVYQPWETDFWGTIYQNPGEIIAERNINSRAGNNLLEFSVSFSWLGDGAPGLQEFMPYYYNPDYDPDYDPEDDRFVQWPSSESQSEDGRYYSADLNDTSPVPEPQTFMLLGTGILALAAFNRRNILRKTKRRNI